MKQIIEPVELSKEEKEFLSNNIITLSGLEKFVNGEIDFFDRENILIMQYLSQKKWFIEQQIQSLKNKIEQYNKAIQLAKQVNVNQNLNGELLAFFEIEVKRQFSR